MRFLPSTLPPPTLLAVLLLAGLAGDAGTASATTAAGNSASAQHLVKTEVNAYDSDGDGTADFIRTTTYDYDTRQNLLETARTPLQVDSRSD